VSASKVHDGFRRRRFQSSHRQPARATAWYQLCGYVAQGT
jgi:hypothetical protein